MIRRLVRFVAAGLCALSLLASLATGWLWWRSHRVGSGGGDRVSRYVARQQARYTLVSHRGKLILYAPPSDPPKGRAVEGMTAKDLAAGLTNGDIEWRAYAEDEHLRRGLYVLGLRPDQLPHVNLAGRHRHGERLTLDDQPPRRAAKTRALKVALPETK